MKKVLIIGAGFLQAYVIKRAKELGYTTYAVDGCPTAVGFAYADHFQAINIVDSEACLQYARENGIDGVLTAATDYGVLTASYIAEKLHLNGLDFNVATLIKNKYLVRKAFFENHVDDTEQAYLVDGDTDIVALARNVTYPVMVKPCDGSGSRGVSRVDNAEAFAEACKYAMEGSVTRRAAVEAFIHGREYGVESFVENGKIHVLAIMKKWMTEPPLYAELGHAIPSGFNQALEEKIRACVTKALQVLGVNYGSVNMDILVTDSGKVHIVDIGARMGGNLIGSHIIPLGIGMDYMGNMIRAAVGDATDFSPCGGNPVATRLLALTPGTVKKLPDFSKIEKECHVMIEHHLHVGDVITPYRTNLDGCGYVIACAESAEESIAHAERARALIDSMIERV